MIGRIWHGWNTLANADAYETLLRNEIFVDIKNCRIAGFRENQLFRRNLGDEEEFATIMWLDDIDASCVFAEEDCQVAVVPPKARKLLSWFDPRSQHCQNQSPN